LLGLWHRHGQAPGNISDVLDYVPGHFQVIRHPAEVRLQETRYDHPVSGSGDADPRRRATPATLVEVFRALAALPAERDLRAGQRLGEVWLAGSIPLHDQPTAGTVVLPRRRTAEDQQHCRESLRVIELGLKNYLFGGADSGGDRAVAKYTILQSAKLNGVNPEAYLRNTLASIAGGYPISGIHEPMPWTKR
jgi:transposase